MMLAPLPAEVYVEGTTDVPIIRSLLEAAQWQVDASGIQVARGVKNIRKRMSSHAQAAQYYPRILFVDSDHHCPKELRVEMEGLSQIMPIPAGLIIRVVDVCVKSWILADRDGLAAFCGLNPSAIPDPVALGRKGSHKEVLLNVLSRARIKDVREAMVRTTKGKLSFGPLYGRRLADFATRHWSAIRAAGHNDSLARALVRLTQLHDSLEGGCGGPPLRR